MPDYKHVLQKYVDMSFEELLDMAGNALCRLTPSLHAFFRERPGQDLTSQIVILLMTNALGVDGKLSAREVVFVNALLGRDHDVDLWVSVIQASCTPESQTLLDEIIDSLDAEAASDMATAFLCLLAADETITREETALFRRLVG